MENHLAHPLAAQAVALFQIYDQAGIGQISRHALLRFFSTIDQQITEEWLTKIMLEQGAPLKSQINCGDFIKIIQAMSAVADVQVEQRGHLSDFE